MRANPLYSDSLLRVEVVVDAQRFALLEGEWEELYRDSPAATPFQSWAWLYSWWEFYGGGRGLRLVTVRSAGGLLVGVLPLMLERRWGFGKLLFIGSRLATADYLDVLIRRGWHEQASEAAARALTRIDGWHVAELRELRPEATAWALFECFTGPKANVWQAERFFIDATKDWDQLLMSRSKRLRNNARRALRRAEADGVRCEWAGVGDVERAARRLVALHREMRRGRHIVSDRLTARFESFTMTAACRMAARGLGGISEFWLDGEVIISELLIFGPGYVGADMVGNSREAFRRYEVSALTAHTEVNIARRWDSPYVSLGRGPEPYKLRWGKAVPYDMIVLSRSSLLWRFYFPIWRGYRVYRSLRLGVREYLKSDTTPKWVKDAAKQLRRRDA